MGDRFPRLAATLAAHRLFASAEPDPTGWAVLKANGVDLDTVTNLAGPIVRSLVTFWDGRFEYDYAFGEIAFVIAVHGEDAETVVDLCAWSARDPATFGTMFGAGILGIDSLMNPASYIGRPCMLFGSPLAWLRANCAGAVVLDFNGVRAALGAAPGVLTTDSLELAESLVRSGIVPARKVVVPAAWGRAA